MSAGLGPTILLIRHAEKPAPGLSGVKLDGNPSDHSLIPLGWQRAGALVRFFVPDGDDAPRSFPKPQLLLAACPDAPGAAPSEKSRREEETIQPLAQFLGVEPYLGFGKGDEKEAAAFAMAAAETVLIAWEHEAIPVLARHIAPGANIPEAWPKERFDLVWVFRPQPDGSYSFEQVPQRLLAGDSDSVVDSKK